MIYLSVAAAAIRIMDSVPRDAAVINLEQCLRRACADRRRGWLCAFSHPSLVGPRSRASPPPRTARPALRDKIAVDKQLQKFALSLIRACIARPSTVPLSNFDINLIYEYS